MDDKWNGKDRRHIKLLFALGCLVLLLVATAVALMHFLVQVHSEACQSGLRAEEKCRNVTNHLRSQLSMAWQVWREDQTTCNRTMEKLNATLTNTKTQVQKQQEQMQDLRDEITDLKRKLQESQEREQHLRSEIPVQE
nr:bone marrow stromal antigen 2 isoform X2 [Cavia porcellus]